MRRKIILTTTVILVSLGAALGYIYLWQPDKVEAPSQKQPVQKTTPKTAEDKTDEPKPTTPAPFNKQQRSVDDPNSLWVVVNKKRPLPSTFAPSDLVSAGGGQLRAEAAAATSELLRKAAAEGVGMSVLSAYRSYGTQQSTYQGWVSRDGQALADTYSARPGHSEHQTGLGVDVGNGVCNLEICFGNTPAGQWLVGNAYKYGFIIRYPNGKTPVTGYQYEPWHLRYVGTDLAAEIQKTGETMEEFFGLPAAPTY